MKWWIFGIGALWAASLRAQDTTYVPATDFPNGRQVVAIYFGAKWCAPCMQPTMKEAVRRMKPLLREQAAKSGASISVVLVALDRSPENGLAFAQSLGAFDEYVFGNDIAGLASERFIWGVPDPQPGVPQVVVGERTVLVTRGKPITFSPFQMTRRILGDSIPIWVAHGAPVR